MDHSHLLEPPGAPRGRVDCGIQPLEWGSRGAGGFPRATASRVLSLRGLLCLVAAGEADLYPRLGRTMEWDTAAGHAVLAAAGGRVTRLDSEDLAYGKPGFENPDGVAMGLPPGAVR